MKMKDEKQKHNHKLTDLIKACIFGILMIAPLFASVSQMLYVTLNKNAKDSYGASVQEGLTKITNVNNMLIDQDYVLNYVNNQTTDNYSTWFGFSYINVDYSVFSGYDVSATYNLFRVSTTGYIYFQAQGFPIINRRIWGTTSDYAIDKLLFTYNGTYTNENDINKGNSQLFFNSLHKDTLDNAFYYGVSQMTKSDLFNWTQNTAIYTGVKAMTDNLQIQTPTIAILIVYWFILTIIYVIIDIVLKCFTTITHMIFRAD